MQITFDDVARAIYLAAVVALILGIGRSTATSLAFWRYFHEEKKKDARTRMMEAEGRIISEGSRIILGGLLESWVSIVIFGIFLFLGMLDSTGQVVTCGLIGVAFVLIIATWFLQTRWL
jgi:hypothetical protein